MARDMSWMALKHSVGPILALIVGSIVVGFVAVAAYLLAIAAGIPRLVAVAAPVLVMGVSVLGFQVFRRE